MDSTYIERLTMARTRKATWPFLTGAVLGGVATYFLDLNNGSERRAKIAPTISKAQSAVTGSGSAGAQAFQTVKETVKPGSSHTPDNPTPDDLTLRDRVESELFKNPETSREHINVNVVDGIVELRGEQDSQSAIDALIQSAKSIANVKGVHSYLHLPGTPAPNKESAIEAS